MRGTGHTTVPGPQFGFWNDMQLSSPKQHVCKGIIKIKATYKQVQIATKVMHTIYENQIC